jgi:hypothetical protein
MRVYALGKCFVKLKKEEIERKERKKMKQKELAV